MTAVSVVAASLIESLRKLMLPAGRWDSPDASSKLSHSLSSPPTFHIDLDAYGSAAAAAAAAGQTTPEELRRRRPGDDSPSPTLASPASYESISPTGTLRASTNDMLLASRYIPILAVGRFTRIYTYHITSYHISCHIIISYQKFIVRPLRREPRPYVHYKS